MSFEIRGLSPEERKYTYTQSTQINGQTGCIGHLRADMDSNGEGFFTSWDDHQGDLKTQEFKDEFDHVINDLRKDFLKNRTALTKFCYSHLDNSFGNDREWGVRADTDKYSYLMRLNPNREYNLYCYCYKREWLNQHIEQARRGIRFITPHYEEKFRIPDGDQIRIMRFDGEKLDRTVRFIDDYHIEVGGGFGSNLYHICEFAEAMERNGNTVISLRSSLPEKCFVYVESTDEIGVVVRGEEGYRPTDVKPDKGVSKQKGVEYLNEAMGLSKAQAAAMSAGSLFGWDTKTADPANYNEEGVLQKKQRDRGDAR